MASPVHLPLLVPASRGRPGLGDLRPQSRRRDRRGEARGARGDWRGPCVHLTGAYRASARLQSGRRSRGGVRPAVLPRAAGLSSSPTLEHLFSTQATGYIHSYIIRSLIAVKGFWVRVCVISVTLKPSSCLVVAIETLCYTPARLARDNFHKVCAHVA